MVFFAVWCAAVLTFCAATTTTTTTPLTAGTPQRENHDSTDNASAVFWTLPNSVIDSYDAKALIFALQGIVNRGSGAPRLFVNTTVLDFDFPGSDDAWRAYLAANMNVTWQSLPHLPARRDVVPVMVVGSTKTNTNAGTAYDSGDGGVGGGGDVDAVCALVSHFRPHVKGLALYQEGDGFSVFVALTMSSLYDVLPVSTGMLSNYSACFRTAGLQVTPFADFVHNHTLQFSDNIEVRTVRTYVR